MIALGICLFDLSRLFLYDVISFDIYILCFLISQRGSAGFFERLGMLSCLVHMPFGSFGGFRVVFGDILFSEQGPPHKISCFDSFDPG